MNEETWRLLLYLKLQRQVLQEALVSAWESSKERSSRSDADTNARSCFAETTSTATMFLRENQRKTKTRLLIRTRSASFRHWSNFKFTPGISPRNRANRTIQNDQVASSRL